MKEKKKVIDVNEGVSWVSWSRRLKIEQAWDIRNIQAFLMREIDSTANVLLIGWFYCFPRKVSNVKINIEMIQIHNLYSEKFSSMINREIVQLQNIRKSILQNGSVNTWIQTSLKSKTNTLKHHESQILQFILVTMLNVSWNQNDRSLNS